jgi:galactose mutarotase-like enzyme
MTPEANGVDVLEVEGVRLCVRRRGAELVSMQVRNASGEWRGFLHRDGQLELPVKGWGNHATVMGYYVHRLLGGRSNYLGRTIEGGTHGFLRHFEFGPPVRAGAALVYSLQPSAIPEGAYPLAVGFELSYAVVDGAVVVGFGFENREERRTAHLSFGLHPGFAVTSAYELDAPQGRYVRHMAPGNFLDGRVETLDHKGGNLPIDRSRLVDSYLFELAGVPEPIFVLRDEGWELELDFRGVPYCTLWSDGGPFLCVEPCWGLPDSQPQKPFEEKDGIQTVPPLQTLRASFRMRPLFAQS